MVVIVLVHFANDPPLVRLHLFDERGLAALGLFHRQIEPAEATVEQLMKEVVVMVNASRSSLESVKGTNIADQDKATIDELIEILDLLSQEAEALARYVTSKSTQDLQAYEKAKLEVSPKVEKLLRPK